MWTALQVVVVFAVTVALDYVWALYTLATAERRPLAASLSAVGIYALAGFATINYTGNHWMLIPATLGCFVGTYAAVSKWSFRDWLRSLPFLRRLAWPLFQCIDCMGLEQTHGCYCASQDCDRPSNLPAPWRVWLRKLL